MRQTNLTLDKQARLGNTKLVDYGIQTDSSDWRAHVCVNAGTVYVFPTKLAALLIQSKTYRMVEVPSFIHGQKIITARGYVVPVQDIPRITPVNAKHFIGKVDFSPNLSTTEKGNKAVSVVMQLLKFGWFPLPWDSGLVDGIEMQVSGLDVIVTGRHSIQVKCDYEGGEPKRETPRVTGNLFLQVEECNPLKSK